MDALPAPSVPVIIQSSVRLCLRLLETELLFYLIRTQLINRDFPQTRAQPSSDETTK